MGFTICQARKAKKFSNDARRTLETVKLSSIAERLKNLLEHLRDIAPEKFSQRGFEWRERLDKIREEFDLALGSLAKSGVGEKMRLKIADAQRTLKLYKKTINNSPDSELWHRLREEIQDSISDLTAASLESKGEK